MCFDSVNANRATHLAAATLIFSLCLLLSSCRLPDNTVTPALADATRVVELTEKAAGITELRIQCGAGTLHVRGSSEARVIDVRADVSAKARTLEEAKRLRDEVQVQLLSSDRNRPQLVVRAPETQGTGQTHWVDMVVTVPDQIKVVIYDDSGSLSVRDLRAGIEVTHGAGAVEIANIQGGVKLDNAGESTSIESVTGFVKVEDGTGRMQITSVTGNIDVAGGNGDLLIQHVTGNVRAWANPQGILAKNIDGDLRTYGIAHSSARIEAISGQILQEPDAKHP